MIRFSKLFLTPCGYIQSEEKCQLLKDAGFEFEVSKERKSEITKQMNKSWDEFFAELEQYKERYGQITDIKQRKKKALREWCEAQRDQQAKKKWGKDSDITDRQIHKLTELGFDWQETDTPSKGWDDYFCDWLSCSMKQSFCDDNYDLKQWVETQHTEFDKFTKGVPSLLSFSQVKKLKDGHFPLKTSESMKQFRESWEEMFAQLLLFKIRYKTFDVPDVAPFQELHLWLSQQKVNKLDPQKRNDKTPTIIWEERMRRLRDVGFSWHRIIEEAKESHVVTENNNNTDGMGQAMSASSIAMTKASRSSASLEGCAYNATPLLPYPGSQSLYTKSKQSLYHPNENPTPEKELAAQAAMIVKDVNSRTSNGESCNTAAERQDLM